MENITVVRYVVMGSVGNMKRICSVPHIKGGWSRFCFCHPNIGDVINKVMITEKLSTLDVINKGDILKLSLLHIRSLECKK